MNQTIVLDAAPLGLATNPNANEINRKCLQWVLHKAGLGCTIIIPEIIDYEVRRELLRANKMKGLERLDEFIGRFIYLPINTNAMRLAAQVWALARQQGKPAAPDHALDADMLLIGQYKSLGDEQAVIATTNQKHLISFVRAELWTEI